MSKKAIVIITIVFVIVIISIYRLVSAFELVNNNENVSEPEINKTFFSENDQNVDHFRSQRNGKSSIYSVYNINNYDYGLIITSFHLRTNQNINEVVKIVDEKAYDRFDYGQGSIFTTDFFYTYHPDSFMGNLEIRGIDIEESSIQIKTPNILYLRAVISDDIGLSMNGIQKSFALSSSKSFNENKTIDISLVKKKDVVYLFLLNGINNNIESQNQLFLSEILDFDKIADFLIR